MAHNKGKSTRDHLSNKKSASREKAAASPIAGPTATAEADLPTLSPQEFRELIHKLRTHQAELEMQNEELRRTEQERERYAAQYRALFENMLDVYYKTDMEGHIEVISPSCLTQTGYTQEELLGRSVSEFYADPMQREELLREMLPEGKVNDFEVTLVHKDGSPRIASVTSSLLLDNDGNPVGIEGILRNISERKQMEQALKDLSVQMEHVLTNTPVTHYACHIEGEHFVPTYASANLKRLFGSQPAEILGDAEWWGSNLHPEERNGVVAGLAAAVASGRNHYDHEYRFRLKDGAYCWIHDEMQIMRDKTGRPLEIVGSWLDITERRQAEEARNLLLEENRSLMRQLMQVQEEERRLLARDLHDELGQLLTSIDARAEYIARHADNAELCAVAEEIVRDTRASFDASHATLLRLRPATLDTLGLTAALSELTSQWKKQAGIGCTLRIDGDIDSLDDLHSIAIYRLVQEGLTNACRHGKATAVKVALKIVTQHAGQAGRIQVKISDNGKGLHVQAVSKGMGIIGMRERVHALGGSFLLTHVPRDGVHIEAVLPLDNTEER